jgi:hypothetical protein
MTPHSARCVTCGETTNFERPPEQWQTRAGDYLRLLSPEKRVQAMREIFRNMYCLGCGGELQLYEEA